LASNRICQYFNSLNFVIRSHAYLPLTTILVAFDVGKEVVPSVVYSKVLHLYSLSSSHSIWLNVNITVPGKDGVGLVLNL
jgi:hypothetical protein